MRAGKLDRLVILQRLTETVSPAGTVTRAWTTLGEIRAELVNLATTEGKAGFGEVESTTVILRARHNDDITTGDRIVMQGDFYNIKVITKIGRRRGLEISVERAE